MQDLIDKAARAKAVLTQAAQNNSPAQADKLASELMDIGMDAVAELILNSRRIAVALEKIAQNTVAGAMAVTAELAPFELDAARLRPIVDRILADNGLVSPHNPIQG